MKLHGTMLNNLASAVRSARRLKGQPVHPDTLGHWTDLLGHARTAPEAELSEPTRAMMLELEQMLADRSG